MSITTTNTRKTAIASHFVSARGTHVLVLALSAISNKTGTREHRPALPLMLYRVVPFENDLDVCVAAARATSEQVRFEADDDGRDVHVSANCAPRGIPASRAAARWCTDTPLCDGTPCRRFALVVSDEATFTDAVPAGRDEPEPQRPRTRVAAARAADGGGHDHRAQRRDRGP
jgi:hypothetical protein